MESEQSEYRAAKQEVGCYVLCIDVINISHKKECWEPTGFRESLWLWHEKVVTSHTN